MYDDLKSCLMTALGVLGIVGIILIFVLADGLVILLYMIYQWRIPIAVVLFVIDLVRTLINVDSIKGLLIRWGIIFAILCFILK